MKKNIYLTGTIFLIISMFFTSCSKKSATDPVIDPEVTPYTPGQLVTRSLTVGTDTVVKMVDIAVNYGTPDMPAIFLINQSIPIQKEDYNAVFFPLIKEHLELFMQLWATEFNLNLTGTAEEKAIAYKHFLSFLVFNEVDGGLLVESITSKGFDLSSVLRMINEAAVSKVKPATALETGNSLLYSAYQDNVSPEKASVKYKTVKGDIDFGGIYSIYKDTKELADVWIDFVKKNKPVVDAPDNIISFINGLDTIPSHYTGGTAFKTSDYKLSYDAGIWQAKLTYHLEGTYGATHPTIPGAYITKCNTLSTYVSCKGPSFVVKAKTQYSLPINIGSFDVPAAQMNGKVQTTYGDCCCCQYISYLNFKIDANTGFKQVTFTTR